MCMTRYFIDYYRWSTPVWIKSLFVSSPWSLCWWCYRFLRLALYIYCITHSSLSPQLDPFCIVSFDRYSQTTREIDQTLNPLWDHTCVFDDIKMYGSPLDIKQSPPKIMIEIFDKDNVVSKSVHVWWLMTCNVTTYPVYIGYTFYLFWVHVSVYREIFAVLNFREFHDFCFFAK